MKKLPFAWLGSKRAKKQGAGDKAGLIDMGRRLGLPVPEGVVLLHRLYGLLLDAEVIVEENGRISCPDPLWLHQALYQDARLPPLHGPKIVRAAFVDEAGQPIEAIAPQLAVDFDQPQAVADALCALWTAVSDAPDGTRRDVIIQQLLSIQHEGTAVTDPAYQDDLVTEATNRLHLPQLQPGERITADLPDFGQRLQMLLRGVRHTFGQGIWRVEWADDGQVCWLLQVNPLTEAPSRSELFVPIELNKLLAEVLTPSLGAAIVAACADLYGLCHRLDSRLPADRVLVKLVEERPFINQSLLTDTLRQWGLPTAAAHHIWGVPPEPDVPWQRRRAVRRGWLLLRLGLRQQRTAAQAAAQTSQWRQHATQLQGEKTAVIEAICQLYKAALTAQLCLLGPISAEQPRIAQAQTIWQEETAVSMNILCQKLVAAKPL